MEYKLKALFLIFVLTFLGTVAFATAYSYKIPICNTTINTSCLSINETSAITGLTTPESNARLFYRNGILYLSNDSEITNYTIYYVTNITNVTNIYHYNLTNGSSINIIQNGTGTNESFIREIVKNFYNSSILSYNKTQIDELFATKSDMDNLRNSLNTYASKVYVDDLRVNISFLNITSLNEHLDNSFEFNMIWIVVICVNALFTILLIIAMIKASQG